MDLDLSLILPMLSGTIAFCALVLSILNRRDINQHNTKIRDLSAKSLSINAGKEARELNTEFIELGKKLDDICKGITITMERFVKSSAREAPVDIAELLQASMLELSNFRKKLRGFKLEDKIVADIRVLEKEIAGFISNSNFDDRVNMSKVVVAATNRLFTTWEDESKFEIRDLKRTSR